MIYQKLNETICFVWPTITNCSDMVSLPHCKIIYQNAARELSTSLTTRKKFLVYFVKKPTLEFKAFEIAM